MIPKGIKKRYDKIFELKKEIKKEEAKIAQEIMKHKKMKNEK